MDDVSAEPASAGSESDPVALIERQLEREQTPPTNPAPDQQPDQQPEPEEMPVPEPGPETAPDDGADDEDDGGDEQPEQQPEPPAELYEVKIGDRVEKLTLDELRNGYQRQSDYSRHMNQLAEQRRAAEAAAQAATAERQNYVTHMEQVATVLQAALPPRPTIADFENDPIGAPLAERRWQDSMQQLNGVLGQLDQARQQAQQQQQMSQQQMLQQARERLPEYLPEWKDPATVQREKPLVVNHLRSIGYADHEIGAAADPRALVMARESMLYRQMMQKQATTAQKIAQAPRIMKPGAVGAPPDRAKSIEQRVKRSGGKDIDAIAALLLT